MTLETMMLDWRVWATWVAGASITALLVAKMHRRSDALGFVHTVFWPVAWPIWLLWRAGRWVRGRREKPGEHYAEWLAAQPPAPAAPGPSRVRAWRALRCCQWVHDGSRLYHRCTDGAGVWGLSLLTVEHLERLEHELAPQEAEALNAERLGTVNSDNPIDWPRSPLWGAEGYQRAYRIGGFSVVRFYPSHAVRISEDRGWSQTLVTESHSIAQGDPRLPDAEALAIWRTRPQTAVLGIGIVRGGKLPLTEDAYFTNGPAFADAPVDPKESPKPYSLADARAEGLSKRIGDVERRLDDLEKDR